MHFSHSINKDSKHLRFSSLTQHALEMSSDLMQQHLGVSHNTL